MLQHQPAVAKVDATHERDAVVDANELLVVRVDSLVDALVASMVVSDSPLV